MDQRYILNLHIAVMLFGLAGVIGKYICFPAGVITLGRVFFSTLILTMIIVLKKESLMLSYRKDYFIMIISGVLLAVHWTTFISSIQLSTVAIGTITFSTFPLFITFLEPIIYKEKLMAKNITYAFMMFIGVVITIPEFSLDNKITSGVLTGMISSLTYAILCLINRYLSSKYNGDKICLYEQGVATIVLLPLLFIYNITYTTSDILSLIFLGVVCTAFAHCLYVNSLKVVKVQTAGIISGMETVYSIIFAYIFLKEIPVIREIIGGGIIIFVVFYSSIKYKKD